MKHVVKEKVSDELLPFRILAHFLFDLVVFDGVCREVMMGDGVGGKVLMRWCHQRWNAQDNQLSKRERDDTVNPCLHAVLPWGDVLAPGKRLVPACQGITPCQADTSLYQPAEELLLSKQLVFARRGVIPQAQQYQPAEELLLGKQVQASTCSASQYTLVPEGAIPWRAGASQYLLAEE
ncbi:hypothetical protein PCASD_17045 [Puccinia coronata f. sp. avenae]|uniref:Uncharacterized protein n=1 Tax=Puccinia coronata f. sp. avenae TaxID=200324 RepID=A0A2N5U1K2_9BASI|nr:hypothetical protein PCASD_17736 [Puccinia coronata f. sp. avenae]PLW31631.1 hypothetical protein PCASD_17045 [Puccinia coronata f. sp. avenae]